MTHPCPCSSGGTYQTCCKPFHEGKVPENALQLMRSRYSAYALDLATYIVRTTHPASPQYCPDLQLWAKKISEFSHHTEFKKLEVLHFQERGNLATVTFTAHIVQNRKDATFTEKSFFEKLKNRWLYRSGQLVDGHMPNLVTTGEMRLLPLAYYGEPVLTKKADPISEITEDLRKLAAEMIETMDASDGVGLAAPQVHHSIRLFVIREPIETSEGTSQLGEAKVFINPELSSPSKETWEAGEGCLSIPTIHAEIKRPKEITVEYTDLEGKRVKERCSSWKARIIMHENDHLNGVLFIDRLDSKEKEKLKPILKLLRYRIHDGTEL